MPSTRFRFRTDHFLDARRRLAFPVRTGDQETAAVIARSPTADIVEIKGVRVNELNAEIAFLLDRGNGQDDRLGPQVHADHRVRRVRVRRLYGFVLGRVDTWYILQLVPRPFVLGTRGIHKIRVLDAIAVDHWEAIDISLLSNCPGVSHRNCRAGGVIRGCSGLTTTRSPKCCRKT